MASQAARRLTDAHRLAQARLGVQTVARMRVIWPLLNPDNLDGSFDQWLLAAVPLIQAQRAGSARLAANYLAAFKTLELGTGAKSTPVLDETANVATVTTSLLVTGPLSVKRAMTRGIPLVKALSTAQAASSASAMRHVLDGGRGTVMRTLNADRHASGWARVSSGNACRFCKDLDGKFHRDDTADFAAHDGCSCSQEPVYR